MADRFTQTESQIRLGRNRHLNTIVEDKPESQFDTKSTIDGKPSAAGRRAAVPVNQTRSTRLSRLGLAHRAVSPASTSSSGSRNSWLRRNHDFDDLYDATDEDDEGEMSDSCPSLVSQGNSESTKSSQLSTLSSSSRNKYPAIIIPPSLHRAKINAFHKNSPVPPTPPPKIPVSPEALSRIPRAVPEAHAPPSLDGSAASDHPSTLSAPLTPQLEAVSDVDWDSQYLLFHIDSDTNGCVESPCSATMSPQVEIEMDNPEDWSHVLGRFPLIPENGRDIGPRGVPDIPGINRPASTDSSNKGVELPTNALAILQRIEFDSDSDRHSEISGVNEIVEMQEVKLLSSRPGSMNAAIPASAGSTPFTPLSIPSPGGFFSSLGGDAQQAWRFPIIPQPLSATAENFYNCSWNLPAISDDVLPATPHLGRNNTFLATPTPKFDPWDSSETSLPSKGGERNSAADYIADEYDELYDEELKFQAASNLDRTTTWLAAQTTYLSALRETNPANQFEGAPVTILVETPHECPPNTSRKSEVLANIRENGVCLKPHSHPAGGDALFYRGFQRLVRQSTAQDAFFHNKLRYESIQAIRLSFMDKHVDGLLGKYVLNNIFRPPYRGPFSQAPRNSTVPQILADQAKFSNLEKEQDVAHQLHNSMWAVEALKFLKGGSLLPTSAVKRFVRAKVPRGDPKSASVRRIRVLDIGGEPSCGWAWHVSNDYPNVKVYTTITKHQIVNPGMKGPSNHRQISVPNVWRLPFRDNQFDVISSRTFHSLLKTDHPCGEEEDEYNLCLKECFRCLKPGGILEFFLMDSEIIRAGPCGAAVSVEFGFNLKTRGYDPSPTKSFIHRLHNANFAPAKRAWMFLPLGTETSTPKTEPGCHSDIGESMGTTSNIAGTTGLLGGWMWEQWMVKLQMEMGREKGKLLEEVTGVYAEGQKSGAGWRCLTGWAMKPKNTHDHI
ncbi:hypothetical protein I7I51_02108 [Histoplasma capsulatum]|uniref:Methyltransferase type 11 domain-containing protein n=1 Tax=Ajellomyces capsulatus TaxID=5037 RepID=A0A8A1MIS8_AJECA|nr:hypothetical protein I7I51_02108 [Histoplasma capsulatum]